MCGMLLRCGEWCRVGKCCECCCSAQRAAGAQTSCVLCQRVNVWVVVSSSSSLLAVCEYVSIDRFLCHAVRCYYGARAGFTPTIYGAVLVQAGSASQLRQRKGSAQLAISSSDPLKAANSQSLLGGNNTKQQQQQQQQRRASTQTHRFHITPQPRSSAAIRAELLSFTSLTHCSRTTTLPLCGSSSSLRA